MLLRAEGKGVHVDARVGAAGVVLEGLDNIEVVALTLREAVLAVELELGRDDGVLTPTVHVEGGLGENKGAGIRNIRSSDGSSVKAREGTSAPLLLGSKTIVSKVGAALGAVGIGNEFDTTINSTGHLEEAVGGDESIGAGSLGRPTKRVNRVG